MIQSIVISRIVARYSIIMALKAAEQEIKTYARTGRIPVIAGLAAGVIVGRLISGVIGAVIGVVSGAMIIHAYRHK